MNRHGRAILALAAGAVGILLVGAAVASWGWAFGVMVAGAGVVGAVAFLGVRVARQPGGPAGPPLLQPRTVIRQVGAQPALPPLARLQALSPAEFEEFTRLLFTATGLYHDVRRVGRSGDGGVDLTMRDGAGNLCVVQCKRYRGTVPAGQIRDLAGVMMLQRPREAYLVTTGRVSANAQAVLGTHLIHVWDGPRLVTYARQYLGDRFEDTIKRARS